MKTKIFMCCLSLFVLFVFIGISCKKSDDTPTEGNKIELGTSEIDSVSYTIIKVSTELVNTGGNQITKHGHCWGINSEPTLDDDYSDLGSISKPGSFTSEIEGLLDNTLYYIRPYTQFSNGTVYGSQIDATTWKTGKPYVITSNISDLGLHSAICGGTVVSDSGMTVTTYGVCWDTQSNPDLNNFLEKTEDGNGTGEFVSAMTDLSEYTMYYVRAYAINNSGIGYGEAISFFTAELTLPTVITSQVTGITTNSAISGGEVTDAGNGNITQRGVCWGVNATISIDDCIGLTDDGTGIGEFISNITELNDGTQYFVKAYATNEKGTGYGSAISFTVQIVDFPTVTTSDVTDITFNSANCGGDVTNEGNGNVHTRGVCWSTQGNPTIEDCEGFSTDGSGLGTFTSSASELTENETYYLAAYATNEKGTAYGEIRTFSTLDLTLPEVTTESISGISFTTASGGGNVISNGNGSISARGVCWSTDPMPTLENADGYTLNGTGLGNYNSNISNLISSTTYYVAAFATNEKGTDYGEEKTFTTLDVILPQVETREVSDISYHSALSGGLINSAGSGNVVSRGVCWDIYQNPSLENNIGFTTNQSGIGEFTSNLVELEEGIIYYVRAYATNTYNGTSYGEEFSFETLQGCGIINYIGKDYTTIIIGDQCWMAENLNVGTMIDVDQEQTDNSIMEKYCYGNLESNCDIYGGLYQWNEVMQYETNPGERGLCPSGWHVPTDEEWKVLEGTVDSQYGTFSYEWDKEGYRGFDAGLNLKSKEGWAGTGNNGLDLFGFNALPAGYRNTGGFFTSRTHFAYIHTSLSLTSYSNWYRKFDYTSDKISRDDSDKATGRSARCLKDD